MAARSDAVAIAEAAYMLDGEDTEWLEGIARSALPLVGNTLGALGFVYDVHDRSANWMRSFTTVDLDPACRDLVKAVYDSISPAQRNGLLSGSPAVNTVSQVMTQALAGEIGAAGPIQDVSGMGWADGVAICGRDTSGIGCIAGFLAPSLLHLGPRDLDIWNRLASHITSALRLRQRLNLYRDLLRDENAKAIMDPDGTLHHAVDEAQDASARRVLREAVQRRERARGSLRRSDANEALSIWKALVAGRWSLLDRFESDGRRYIVALPNAPSAPDPRGLTQREEAVAEYVALGHPNKRIAYALGIAEGTVAALVHRILRKFGVPSRAALVDLFAEGERLNHAVPLGMVEAEDVVALVAPESHTKTQLTRRQAEIVRRISEGCTNLEIAERLGCSPHTIANTMQALFRKAGVGSRAELVRWALNIEQRLGEQV